MLDRKQRYRGSLLGLAVGDALGTTLEFQPRGTFEPLTDMCGGGPFHLKPGQWTDDTSMALCLAHSLLACEGFDANDQMQRYCEWRTHGYMSSNGRCFDIGVTVSSALSRFLRTGEPYSGSTDPFSAGNGSIMRLAPVALFFSPAREKVIAYAQHSSRTTHGARECVESCGLFAELIHLALNGTDRRQLLSATRYEPTTSRVAALKKGEFLTKSYDDIQGTGYVIDSLEAALWCFIHTESYAEAVLAAVNLGDDADTTAAVCGQLAGAYYGEAGIPQHWLEPLVMREDIGLLAQQLLNTER